MSWSATTSTTGNARVISYDKSKAMIGQVRLDYESAEGVWPAVKVHTNVIFFGTTTRTVTEYVGLSYSTAKAACDASGATSSTYAVSVKTVLGVAAELLFEKSSKVTSMRRVDASGQYAVTVTETSQVTDGTETTLN